MKSDRPFIDGANVDEYEEWSEAYDDARRDDGGADQPEPEPARAPRWLVKNRIPETGTGLLSGQWGTFKTFGALDLTGSVTTGLPFAGCRVKRQGGVLIIAAEGSGELNLRLRGLVEGRLRKAVLPVPGFVAVCPDRLPVAWIDTCPPLVDPKSLAILCGFADEAVARMQADFGLPLVLTIIDTIGASAGLSDGNASAENRLRRAR
jgi:AAA domain